ncbi:hypothetical protein JOD64_000234 [Micromonospora luteifusca]|uniref:SnoaL-like domain-containing protein n=1 Tax=Micromonospora luteifusca TaxID=709860 RepID=A0ABS2LLL4_9ACTN|nr:hypothetical protein [Micromonospora luteifusca]MBM7489012.1 hypothetical protein [Micromonospora luteifusca]
MRDRGEHAAHVIAGVGGPAYPNLLSGDLTEALDKFYAPDYTHRSDGKTLDRAEFVEMVTRVRAQIVSGTVTVLDELRDGLHYAERHVFGITMADGSTAKREIAIFGTWLVAVKLDQLGLEVGAHVPHDLFHPGQVSVNTLCRTFVTKTKCRPVRVP